MKSKLVVVSGLAAVVAGTLLCLPRTGPGLPAAPVKKAAAAPDPSQHPALACYRVFEDEPQDDVLPYRGANYSAQVRPDGLRFEAGGHRMSLRARRLEQGGQAVDLSAGGPARTRFAAASVDRGEGVREEFIFENRRVEHLVHLERPIGDGAVVVRVAVDTNLTGPVQTVRRGDSTWKDTTLTDGGLVFTDASGTPGLAYHGAVAIDATGRRQLFDPRWENGEIALEVPASFLKDAAYPVVIDPWLELNFSGSGGGISLTGTVSESPAITLVGGGAPAVAWSDASSGNFEIFFRYWSGTAWTALGTSGSGGGVSATSGTSTNPSIGHFNPTGTSLTHPFIAWEDDTSGTTNIYAKFWTGSTWAQLAGSATSSGISLTLGTPARNPQALGVTGFVENDPLGTEPSRVEILPCVVYEIQGGGIRSKFFYPGDNRDQAPPAGWYQNPAGGTVTSDPSASRPSAVVDGENRLTVVWEGTNGGTQFDIFAFQTSSPANDLYAVLAGVPIPYTTPGGSTGWDPVGNLTGNVCSGLASGLSIQPSIAVDGANTLWVAWQESVGAEREIYVRSSAGGGAWTQVANSSTGLGVSRTSVVGASTSSSFPSIAVNGVGTARPVVAWEDDASGNSEIYVRRFNPTGLTWDQVADEGSAMLVAPEATGNNGGVSRTPSFSLRPKAVVSDDGGISVVWRDGAAGTFDLLLRRYYDNAPTALQQQAVNGLTLTPLAVGGTSSSTTVQFSSVLVAESSTLPINLRLQVEVRPNTSPFTEQVTQDSQEVASGGTATILFTGLPNVNYHWRARSIDAAGRTSPWVSFGSNADGAIDFRINSSATGSGGPNTLGGGKSKDKCGLTGLEVFAALALAAGLRRTLRRQAS